MKIVNLAKACVLGVSLILLPAMHVVAAEQAGSVAAVSQAAQPVNINTADADTLAGALRGIGLKKAEAIVAYRAANGPFKTVDELANVKGIGDKTLEQLRPQLTL
jgi:competence protein ComEA